MLDILLRSLQRFSVTDEDRQRQQFILNTLLVGSLVLSFIALGIVFITPLITGRFASVTSMYGTVGVTAFFAILRMLAKKGYVVAASFLFCLLYLLLATALILVWGILVPQALLLFALAIVTSSVLIGTHAGFFFTALTTVTVIVVTWLHESGIVLVNLAWREHSGTFNDATAFIFTFLVLMVTAWLSNREIERSFARASAAEILLKNERDSLERTVEERTHELKERQRTEMLQLYEFAYFGRVTSSLLHDLVNPISTVSLALRRIDSDSSSELIQRALTSTERIERFIQSARNQLRRRQVIIQFSLVDEVERALQTVSERIETHGISLVVELARPAQVEGDPVKLYRLVTNLVHNAIDACAGLESPRIWVRLAKLRHGYRFSVQDTGPGIPAKDIPHVFEPFFTTKEIGKGMGIGLSICKEIVEQDFHGEITIIQKKTGVIVQADLCTHEP